MVNALLALVSNSRNVNPYFAICQKTISGTTSGWSFFCRFGPSTLAECVGGKADDLSRRPIEQAVLQAIMWCRPISLSLNTGSGAPYFAFAQYGLWLRLCARAGALARIRLRGGRGYVLGQVPLRAYACGSSSIARWAIRRANADWERPDRRLSN